MNPVVASSLVSMGKDLLDRVTTPSPNLPHPNSTSFANELNEVSAAEKSLSNKELKEEFINSSTVQSFLEKNSGDTLYLEKRADGSMQILSSNGRTLILKEGSEACSTAKKFFESCLKEQAHLSDNRPNAVEIKV